MRADAKPAFWRMRLRVGFLLPVALVLAHGDQVLVGPLAGLVGRRVEVLLALARHVRIEVPLAALGALELLVRRHLEPLLQAAVRLVFVCHRRALPHGLPRTAR